MNYQDYNDAKAMEQELHEAHIAESEARVRVCNASAFMWVALGLAALVVAFAYAI